jgi:hypothetical protein
MRRNLIGALATGAALLAGAGIAVGGGGGGGDDSLRQVQDSKPMKYPDAKTAKMVCPGKNGRVASGGWKTDNDAPGFGAESYPFEFIPTGKQVDKFEVTAWNRHAAEDEVLTGYAYCFNGRKPKITKHTVNVGSEEIGFTNAPCPDNKTVLGGGFKTKPKTEIEDPIFVTNIHAGSQGQFYSVAIYNGKDVAVNLTVYAVCGAGRKAEGVGQTVPMNPGDKKSVTANCPNNKDFLFAGVDAEFDESGFDTTLLMELRRSGNGARAKALIPGIAPDGGLAVVAYCR